MAFYLICIYIYPKKIVGSSENVKRSDVHKTKRSDSGGTSSSGSSADIGAGNLQLQAVEEGKLEI